ncbi:MAG: tRNA (N6-isopentenyl adenosine(37)-C2)-methylthiotransferase MiaB [Nitrospiraceae bacterium]|nr:MAG: tRNA (N6-isopentenyl adenosine(37)-C2)-methylthiotransferase MiaB [Nitrospiraceae bacterium]
MLNKFHIHTFGCQMNVHDSEKIAGIFSQSGFQEADGSNNADVIVLNTCSIREKAEQKFYSELGRLKKAKKNNPDLKIAVAGCIAQQEKETLFKRFPYIDFVFGPDNIDNLQRWVTDREQDNNCDPQTTALKTNPYYHTKTLPVKRGGQVRAWVSIMYGCDNFCTYCVVPYTRGRERSRSSKDIFFEVKSLAENGFKEITLLGQNVNSYGITSHENIDFTDLLYKLHEIELIQRIRFVTSHPRDFSEKLIRAIKDLPNVCDHLHLPLQAGSDDILKSMNRGYTFEEYKRKIDLLRASIPHVSITTDIIVGFPGETEEDFQCTLNSLAEIQYDGIFAFKYSKRPGTGAIELPDHIDERTKSERLRKILKFQEDITYRKNKSLEGHLIEILVEGTSENDTEKMTGRTTTNKIVNFYGDSNLTGKLIKVKILDAKQHSLYGEAV